MVFGQYGPLFRTLQGVKEYQFFKQDVFFDAKWADSTQNTHFVARNTGFRENELWSIWIVPVYGQNRVTKIFGLPRYFFGQWRMNKCSGEYWCVLKNTETFWRSVFSGQWSSKYRIRSYWVANTNYYQFYAAYDQNDPDMTKMIQSEPHLIRLNQRLLKWSKIDKSLIKSTEIQTNLNDMQNNYCHLSRCLRAKRRVYACHKSGRASKR